MPLGLIIFIIVLFATDCSTQDNVQAKPRSAYTHIAGRDYQSEGLVSIRREGYICFIASSRGDTLAMSCLPDTQSK